MKYGIFTGDILFARKKIHTFMHLYTFLFFYYFEKVFCSSIGFHPSDLEFEPIANSYKELYSVKGDKSLIPLNILTNPKTTESLFNCKPGHLNVLLGGISWLLHPGSLYRL